MRDYRMISADSRQRGRHGSVLILVLMAVMILAIVGMGMLTIAYGVQQRAITVKNEASALLAAEAGYERAIYWMAQQNDVLVSLDLGVSGSTGTLSFANSSCSYSVQFGSFINATPVYRVSSTATCGRATRTVAVDVIQAIQGWAMGACEIPTGISSTSPVNFAGGEIIDMPLHINKADDSPDNKDIHITGTPDFRARVSMGESRYRSGGADKYGDTVIGYFDEGIYFNQPDSKITDPAILQSRLAIFKQTVLDQKAEQVFTPQKDTTVTGTGGTTMPAVHIEFYKGGDGKGYVKVTNNCTVVGGKRSTSRTYDYMVDPANPNLFTNYNVYGYHYVPKAGTPLYVAPLVKKLEDAKVTPTYGGQSGNPGGQIFVDGNVIIGGDTASIVQGTMTVAATGNIWIANSVKASDTDDAGNTYTRPAGMLEPPRLDNPNALGLISKGVIKVVDPGMSNYGSSSNRGVGVIAAANKGNSLYKPIGIGTAGSNDRKLPDSVEVEAALTIGGGGWGAENVERGSYGDRKENGGSQDNLYLRGTIQEVVRGVVGIIGADGFLKYYIMDQRMMQGILPGNVWLAGKFIPAPAGWHDFR